jgi:APA family basic amino acid/polyamine antiporter
MSGAAQAAPHELSTSDRLQDRREVAAGTRAYSIGFEDGRFYANGWHITGEMSGGVWTPPIKLVDGVWFGIDGQDAPLAFVLRQLNFDWAATLISFGALVAITSVVLTILYGQTRITFAMCRDGLLPSSFAKLSPRQTPARITAVFALLICAIAAFFPLEEIAKLVNIGTLFAFVITNIGVIVLRHTRPDLKRTFKVPFSPVFPLIGAGLAIFLMKYLERATWIRFVGWMAIGLAVYFLYGIRHSKLRQGVVANPEAEV